MKPKLSSDIRRSIMEKYYTRLDGKDTLPWTTRWNQKTTLPEPENRSYRHMRRPIISNSSPVNRPSSNQLLTSQCLPMHRLPPLPSSPLHDSATNNSSHTSFISTGTSSTSSPLSYFSHMTNSNKLLRTLTSSRRRNGTP